VHPFGEPQLQGKSDPYEYRSQEGQVDRDDMEGIRIQLKYQQAIAAPNL